MKNYDLIIVGAGPVGLFGAFQAGLLGMSVCVIDALEQIGGQCAVLYPEKPIYDIPAHPKITAINLVKNLFKQNSIFPISYELSQEVVNIDSVNDVFQVTTSKKSVFLSKAVVIAAGSGKFIPNKPPIPNLSQFEDKSFFYYVKHKETFAKKKLMILGGGDSAVDWAIELSSITDIIYLVHRRDKFKASPNSLESLKNLVNEQKVNILTPFQIFDIVGTEGKISSVLLKDLDNNIKHITVDSILSFFGLVQNIGHLSHIGLQTDKNYIKSKPPFFETNIAGIYAVGDVALYEGKIKLILIGFSEISSAIHHMYPRIFNKSLHFQHSTEKLKNKNI